MGSMDSAASHGRFTHWFAHLIAHPAQQYCCRAASQPAHLQQASSMKSSERLPSERTHEAQMLVNGVRQHERMPAQAQLPWLLSAFMSAAAALSPSHGRADAASAAAQRHERRGWRDELDLLAALLVASQASLSGDASSQRLWLGIAI